MVGENWDLTLCQVAIGWSDPVWKLIQTFGKKSRFDTLSNRNWVIGLGLKINSNGRGKIGI
jgi:hypothetical protein